MLYYILYYTYLNKIVTKYNYRYPMYPKYPMLQHTIYVTTTYIYIYICNIIIISIKCMCYNIIDTNIK